MHTYPSKGMEQNTNKAVEMPEEIPLQELPGANDNCPLRISHSVELGRFLVVVRDVAEGEVLLRDTPLVVGPQAKSAPICFGCYKPLGLSSPYLCSNCGSALLCGPACEKLTPHTNECAALRDALPFSATLFLGENANWQVVTPLRCFVNQIKSIFQMESHLDARRKSGAWLECEKNVVRILHHHGLLRNFPDHAIQRVCGILDVNSFEFRGPSDDAGRSECLRGIYSNASFMAHSCIANTHVAVAPDFTIVIKAACRIAKGDAVLCNYADTLMCTPVRREHLMMGKYFSCQCLRCKDPSELSSHLSSLRCLDASCSGAVMSEDPLRTALAPWKCDTCGRTLDAPTVHAGMMSIQREMQAMNHTDARAMEALLTRLARSLHPQHAAMLEVTQALSGLYREQILDMGSASASPALLRRKMDLCGALLPVVEKLEPPLSRLKGITLYEMASPLAALAQKDRATDSVEALAKLTRAEEQLREAARLLLHEPPGAPEARLARLALLELKTVRQDIADLEKIIAKKSKKTMRNKKK